ncbi:nuclear transport factor 2 family protein [Winogradskyella sp.]|uniref:nuclear transport factor 2 family protein n=1 Tax=Winogradskyella sp. TaxID=1883156 RepID=UPI003BAB5B79
MKYILILMMALFVQPISIQEDETGAIKATLENYINGSTGGKPDLLRTAFHPDLNLYYVRNNKLKVWSGEAYIKDTKEGQPTGESGEILSVDYTNDIAVAKVMISSPNTSAPYIDYFLLAKAEGKWTIIHKAFTKKTD